MNEPYQRVHQQENSNSTLGSIAKHTGIGLAMAGALEGGSILGAKHIKNQTAKDFFNTVAYAKPEGRFMSYLGAGAATKKGRIVNYGGSVLGGLIAGMIESKEKQ